MHKHVINKQKYFILLGLLIILLIASFHLNHYDQSFLTT